MPLVRVPLRPKIARLHLAMMVLVTAPSALPAPPPAPAWAHSLATTLVWHDNATNGENARDTLPAAQVIADFAASHRLVLGRNDTLLLVGRVVAESWPRYDGLDRAGPGLRGIWQHKFARGAFAPTLRLDCTGDLAFAREPNRSGRSGSVALTYRQRLHSTLVVDLGHERTRYDARTLAFDRTAAETGALATWQANSNWHLSVALRRRHGTVLAYSHPPRPDLLAKGKTLVFVDTFAREGPLIAYYFPATTRSAEIRANRPLGPDHAVSLGVTWRKTTHGIDSSYRNRIFSAAVQRQF